MADFILKDEDSALDLMLRGFTREQVRERTGEDIGYHGSALRKQAAGIDRIQYKIEYVIQRVSGSHIDAVLDEYAQGLSKAGVLARLGLHGENILKLSVLFEGLGRAEQFQQAHARARRTAMMAGMRQKHGVENPFALEQFQQKAGDTREQRYGARYTLAEGSVLAESARESFNARMRDDGFAEQVRNRKKQASQRRYGTDAPMQSQQVKDAVRQAHRRKYGVDSPNQLSEARERASQRMVGAEGRRRAAKARQTIMQRYDVEHISQLPEYRRAQSERMRDSQHQRRVVKARKMNGTMRTSSSEQELYALLVEHFGSDDVLQQHRDEQRYAFVCDFYVPSQDLFIELNGTWTHGGHWYDRKCDEDQGKAQRWSHRSSAYFDNALQTWTVRDVAKRVAAESAELNYVVFWDAKTLSDAKLWLAMGAPDGKDWGCEYSWLPQRELTAPSSFPALSSGTRAASAAARAATGEVFYARELQMWEQDSKHPAWGSVRSRLYANRYKYLGKLPDELSDAEILRGLTISGVMRGYTAFDNTGMKKVIADHTVQSIYDPCAGWGERLVTAAALGVEYSGVDISCAVVEGHQRLIEQYSLTDQRSVCADASAYDMTSGTHDTVFTCPPYGNAEIYTEQGAENLSEEDFLSWWGQVVEHSVSPSTQIFAYQINQRWKDRMNAVVQAAGFRLIDQIAVGRERVSHFHRSAGGSHRRREFEQVQVFERV